MQVESYALKLHRFVGRCFFEGILVGISHRPCGLVELELALQQRPVFAAADSFRLVGAL